MRTRIIGYRSGVSQSGYPYCMLFALKDIPVKQGCAGQEVDTIRCVPDLQTQLIPELVGQDCELSFTRNYRGDAICNGISL